MQKIWNFSYLIIAVVFFVSCNDASKKSQTLANYIPKNSQTVLKIKNWGITFQDFKKNALLNQLENESFSTFFNDKETAFNYVNPSSEVLLCKENENDSTTHFTLISKLTPNLLKLDSIEGFSQKEIQFNGKTINDISLNNTQAFSVIVDSIFILSTSENILKESISGETKNSTLFSKAYKVKSGNELSYVQELQPLKENSATPFQFASLASFDLQLLPDGVVGNGVVLTQDSIPQLLSVFKGQIPQKNDAATVIPLSANEITTFTFNDATLLESNFRNFRGDSINIPSIFESISEVAVIKNDTKNIVALKSLDTEISWDYLAKYISESEVFREITLYDFNDEDGIFNGFKPLIPESDFLVVFELNDFLFFAPDLETAKSLISEIKNNAVLANAPYFETANAQLAQASSLTVYSLQNNVSNYFTAVLGAKPSKLNNYPFATSQFIYDRNFAHLNFVSKETSSQSQSSGLVNQLLNISIERELLSPPKFFTNHNTSGKDIVVQDVSNVLYFISTNGKVLWKKQLDGAILGSINEVDILRNGKKQLAFTTKNTFYVIDRNGKAVKPFPKKFKAAITQPLSVFDYDNNRKYRFVICQDNDVLMYNSKAEIVTGFKFDKTESAIVLSPQHIRIGNKDYILIAEENGKLNILSRVGKERIKLNKTFEFSDIPIKKEGSDFVVITSDNVKKSISQKGEISSLTLQVSNDYTFEIEGSTKVTLDDNLLRINGLLVELPLGVYAKPQIFRVNKKTYIAITELKENKVYLYLKDGTLLSNFPIYGTTQIDLADANKNQKINVLVKGEPKEIILYQTD